MFGYSRGYKPLTDGPLRATLAATFLLTAGAMLALPDGPHGPRDMPASVIRAGDQPGDSVPAAPDGGGCR